MSRVVGPQGGSRKKRALHAFGWLVSLVLLVWLSAKVYAQAGAIGWGGLGAPALGIAASALLVSYLIKGGVFVMLARTLGERGSSLAMIAAFLVAQVGRFVPGKVWQFAGIALLAKRQGLTPEICVAAGLWSNLCQQFVGATLTVFLLWRVPELREAALAAFVILFALGLILMRTRLFEALLRWVFRRKDAEAPVVKPSLMSLGAGLVGSAGAWALFGVALVQVCRALSPVSAVGFAEATGAIAAGAVLGYAALMVPSGLGVREAAVTLALEDPMGGAHAAAAAIILRVLMMGLELALAVLGGVVVTAKRPKTE